MWIFVYLPLPNILITTLLFGVYGIAVDATNFFLGLKGFYFLGEIKKQEKSVG